MKREFRILPRANIRAKKGPNAGIEGYAAVFNQLSEDLGWFREIIVPGAFADCLAASPDVRCLFNHNADLVLGRTTAKTLRLAEDSQGLTFDCDLPATQAARDLLTSIERGDVSQCSFGFFVRKQKWTEEDDGKGDINLIRELHAADLFDVSPVTFPAYPQTSVDKRSLWPDGLPASVRRMRGGCRRRDDEDEEANANGCLCDCDACGDDNCAACTNVIDADTACQDAGCPNQGPPAEMNVRPDAAGHEPLRMRARCALI